MSQILANSALYQEFIPPVQMSIHSTSFILYQTFLLPVIFFSFLYYVVALSSIIKEDKTKEYAGENTELPKVTIQIPVYNDSVAARCIEHCLKFDYPKEKYHIIVADDSTSKETIKSLDKYRNTPGVSIVHRENRAGFKAGALNNILDKSWGEIILIFDSDYMPGRDFLKRITIPFTEDPEVAFVQTKMAYINHKQNLITKFASSCLMVYHNCFMPLNQEIGSVFFCGTGGAIKKDVFRELGGWNEKSLTEDSDLSLRMLDKGYKQVYLSDLRAPGELPFTLNSFIKQQMRWSYGMTRVFVENWDKILFNKGFTLKQRIMITYITLGYIISPFVLGMTIFGSLSWISGTPTTVTSEDLLRIVGTFLATSGFILALITAIHHEKEKDLFKGTVIGALTIGLVVAVTNTISFTWALSGKEMVWFRTPKLGKLFTKIK